MSATTAKRMKIDQYEDRLVRLKLHEKEEYILPIKNELIMASEVWAGALESCSYSHKDVFPLFNDAQRVLEESLKKSTCKYSPSTWPLSAKGPIASAQVDIVNLIWTWQNGSQGLVVENTDKVFKVFNDVRKKKSSDEFCCDTEFLLIYLCATNDFLCYSPGFLFFCYCVLLPGGFEGNHGFFLSDLINITFTVFACCTEAEKIELLRKSSDSDSGNDFTIGELLE
eukprot:Pgem_evm1s19690